MKNWYSLKSLWILSIFLLLFFCPEMFQYLWIIYYSGRTSNKILVNWCQEIYNRSIKLWLQDKDIETYSTHCEEKSFVAEKFTIIRRTQLTNMQPQYQKIYILIS